MRIKNDAEVKFKVSLDDNEASKSLDNLDKKASKSGDTLSKIGDIGKKAFKTTAIAVGAVSTALGGLIIKSSQMAGELEQQIGGTEAVFGEFASQVQEASKKAFETAGLSANDYMATMNKMGALMQGSGIDTEKSMNLSSEAMQRAADVASIMGIDMESAMESIAGAAKGNFTMMDNLGVAMNATTIEAYALSKGVKKSYNEMTKAEQVTYAMQMFLEKTSYAMGNYAKENETFAGSLQTLKASFSNFMSGAGDFDTVINSLEKFGGILMKSIIKLSPQIIKAFNKILVTLFSKIPTLMMQLLPVVIESASMIVSGLLGTMPMLINSLVNIFPMLINVVKSILTQLTAYLPNIVSSLIQGATSIVIQLANALPSLIPMVVQAILGIIPALLENIPLFINASIQLTLGLINGLIASLPLLIDSLPIIVEALISGVMQAVPLMLSQAPQVIYALATGLINALPSLLTKVPQIWKGIVNGVKEGVSKMKDVGKNLISGLWQGIQDKWNGLKNKVKSFGTGIINKFKSVFGIHSPSKEFAYLGEMNILGLEKGMESMSSDLDSTINGMVNLDYDTSGLDYLKNGFVNVSSNISGSIISDYSNKNNVYVTVNADMDVNKFGTAFVRNVKTFSGGAKNSYNYGGSQ